MAAAVRNDDDGEVRVMHSGQGSVPVPDPTSLTTIQLNREISSLREVIFTRLDGMDKALTLFQETLTRSPTEVEKQIAHLKALHDERFKGIGLQFQERDTRVEQSSRDSKVAVDAALQAAKEAVGEQNKSSALAIAKSENSMSKTIEQMGVMIQATNNGLTDKIDDIKSRVQLIEGKGTGLNAGWGFLVGAAALAATLMSLLNFFKGAP